MSALLPSTGTRDATAKIALNPLLPGKQRLSRPRGLVNLKDKLGGRLPIYQPGDGIDGHVAIGIRPGCTLEHHGLWIELVGQILYKKKKSDSTYASSYDFLIKKKELSPPGQIAANQMLKFSISGCDLPHETFGGSLIRVRYFLRLVCSPSPMNSGVLWRGSSMPNAAEVELIVHRCVTRITTDKLDPLKMEVGIEDCLHIEFIYNRGVYTLNDVIEGKIIFYLAKLRVRHMEIDLLKVENVTALDGSPYGCDSEVVSRFELMDGVPPRHSVIPVRLFLSGQPTTQTIDAMAGRFSVRYYLNLVLVDEEDRRYFKKQEVQLIRAQNRSQAELETLENEKETREVVLTDIFGP